nr:hypothetical protein [uncultured Gellertiella sp.]
MTLHDRHHTIMGLADLTRKANYDEALLALCQAVTGKSGYLANAGYVIRGEASGAILAANGQFLAAGEVTPDAALSHLGLRLESTVGGTPVEGRAITASLMFRLGLLSKMLDLAHAHLEPRISFGQKTLKHQMVKDGFARAYATGLTLREKTVLRLETNSFAGLEQDHQELTRAEMQAEKLMGGHGYLVGGTHAISYLSMLMASMHGRGAS